MCEVGPFGLSWSIGFLSFDICYLSFEIIAVGSSKSEKVIFRTDVDMLNSPNIKMAKLSGQAALIFSHLFRDGSILKVKNLLL